MTVAELNEKLKDFESDSKVVLLGFGGGFNDIESVNDTTIVPLYGAGKEDPTSEKAVCIS